MPSISGITTEALEEMLDRAAAKGASQALAALGLHDEDANEDLKELRNLLKSWKDIRHTAAETMIRMITTAFLIFMAGAVMLRLGVLDLFSKSGH